MKIKHRKDFWAGFMFAVLGVFFIIVAQENVLGTLSRMGPAYFPTILGCLLSGLGLVIAGRALFWGVSEESGEIDQVLWGVLAFILGAVFLFAVSLNYLGLIMSLAILIAFSSLAAPTFKVKEVLAMVVVLCSLCWVIFVYGISMPVAVWPVFF